MLLLGALTLSACFCSRTLNASSASSEEEAEQAILQSIKILTENGVDSRQRSLAFEAYRSAVIKLLPILKGHADGGGKDPTKFFDPRDLVELTPIERSRISVSGLHRDGLGMPLIGRIAGNGSADPNAPQGGFVVPVTALALPDSNGRIELFLADPTNVATINAFAKEFPVAMNLEGWLDEVEATGPPVGSGFRYMLRSDQFENACRPDPRINVNAAYVESCARRAFGGRGDSNALPVLVLLLPDWAACSVLRFPAAAGANRCVFALSLITAARPHRAQYGRCDRPRASLTDFGRRSQTASAGGR
jgi:hypothetical protein